MKILVSSGATLGFVPPSYLLSLTPPNAPAVPSLRITGSLIPIHARVFGKFKTQMAQVAQRCVSLAAHRVQNHWVFPGRILGGAADRQFSFLPVV